jgi:hypothetical protein
MSFEWGSFYCASKLLKFMQVNISIICVYVYET